MYGFLAFELPVLAVALIGTIAYGGGDFMGGRAAARLSAPGAIALAQCTAMLVAIQIFLVGETPFELGAALGPGIAGGVCYAAGLLRLYQGIAYGRIGVVAPVCGVVDILVPLAGDVALAREIGGLQLTGIALCAVAIALLAGTPESSLPVRPGPSSSRLGVESGLGYGTADLFLGMVAPDTGLAALTVARCVAALIAVILLFSALRRLGSVFQGILKSTTAAGLHLEPRLILVPVTLAVAAGAFDTFGHMSYVLVATRGSMAVASAALALFPAVVVLLAVLVLRERITGLQYAGLATSLVGVALIFL